MNDPASASPAARYAGPFGPGPLAVLEELRARFPRYLIHRYPDRFGRQARYIAYTRDLSLPVSAVISADPAEVAAALTGDAE